MAGVTVTQIKTRLRAILATYNGMGTDVTGSNVALLNRPAYEVRARGSTRRRSGRTSIVTTRIQVFVYCAEIKDVTKDEDVDAAFEEGEPAINGLADFLADHTLLQLNTTPAGRALVIETSDWTDEGMGLLEYRKRTYAGFILETLVTYS